MFFKVLILQTRQIFLHIDNIGMYADPGAQRQQLIAIIIAMYGTFIVTQSIITIHIHTEKSIKWDIRSYLQGRGKYARKKRF